jgi:hypothetical protein
MSIHAGIFLSSKLSFSMFFRWVFKIFQSAVSLFLDIRMGANTELKPTLHVKKYTFAYERLRFQ